jgi:hypothetical protein
VAAAVQNAELALGTIVSDLRSLVPPDPTSPRPGYVIGASGRSITFYKVELANDAMVARPVTYSVRATARGNLQLLKNGAPLGGVLLLDLKFSEEKLPDPDEPGGNQESEGNPQLRVVLIGIGADVPASRLTVGDVHELSQNVPLPETTPAAVLELPAPARELAARAVRVTGELPAVE